MMLWRIAGVLVLSAGVGITMGGWLHSYRPNKVTQDADVEYAYRRDVAAARWGGPAVAAVGAAMIWWAA